VKKQKRPKPKHKRREKPAPAELKLNLGAGEHHIEGYIGVDLYPPTDPAPGDAKYVVHDLRKTPWPWKDNSVDDIVVNYVIGFFDGVERIAFIEECWRVLKDGAQVTIKSPHWMSMRSVSDPFYKWPPVCETSFLVFNREFRKINKHYHYPIKCNFDFAANYGYIMDQAVATRNDEFKQMAVKHYNNAVLDITVTLIKRA
jgi:hypothetical protein